MADDPVDVEERIRRRAYAIWEREGRPDGRDADHWALAREEIAIEDNLSQTLLPNPADGPEATAQRTEPVERVESVAVLGDLPGLADQGEEFSLPESATGSLSPPPSERPPPARPAQAKRRAGRR
ncbi:hypothetical protein M2352_002439 [Azospirillum fermentarium]|uniref:DUF2934 domain-containing protein n=1 Tax=Azospirillum fermentarium TaxID=1233114 RepID=UPI0022262A70|nr:DUF2934 domain-containing protein [Azospirillum fermentarium]MCW2246848.1 hypothetical protein [Azospirillum fermentarium]